jgi:hypothetical protein
VRLAGLIAVVVLFIPLALGAFGYGALAFYFADGPKVLLIGMAAFAVGLVAAVIAGVGLQELVRACRYRP